MNRRHYIALSGSVALTGCTGDPSGIISNDSEGTDLVPDSGPEPTETTFEGTGSGLHEITVENDGMTFFRIDTEEPITVSLVNSDNDSPLDLGVDFPRAFTRTAVDTTSEEYALEIEAEDSIDWSITVEDQPIYSEDDVGEATFPIEFSGSSENVFGPFNLDGFHQPRLRTNVEMNLVFANQEGETIQTISADYLQNEDIKGSFVNLDTINISEVCWVWCPLNSLFTAGILEDSQEVSYEVEITEPDN
ncbi:hypothetical protein [Halorubrum sp. Atlit-26R]|uniref:hypothetical protein n=1 Tax=Halorubrum sp. Atlit-26R TaxID=2282128 RepID=UPI0011C3D416|nr:hypothetical protein [Halorubrum sp. Atlit-26R]